MTYESGERTATAIFNWASRRVPNHVTKLSKVNDIQPWSEKVSGAHSSLNINLPTGLDRGQEHSPTLDEGQESSSTMEGSCQ